MKPSETDHQSDAAKLQKYFKEPSFFEKNQMWAHLFSQKQGECVVFRAFIACFLRQKGRTIQKTGFDYLTLTCSFRPLLWTIALSHSRIGLRLLLVRFPFVLRCSSVAGSFGFRSVSVREARPNGKETEKEQRHSKWVWRVVQSLIQNLCKSMSVDNELADLTVSTTN